jgi:hypothetical protein
MTIPTTPGTPARARSSSTKIFPATERSPARRAVRGSLLAALLATAVVALTGALAAAGAQAEPHPDHRPTGGKCAGGVIHVKTQGHWRHCNRYLARVTLDGRKHRSENKSGAAKNYVRAGDWVKISCQGYGKNGRLYDKVGKYFVPDKYIRTLFTIAIPGVPVCLGR